MKDINWMKARRGMCTRKSANPIFLKLHNRDFKPYVGGTLCVEKSLRLNSVMNSCIQVDTYLVDSGCDNWLVRASEHASVACCQCTRSTLIFIASSIKKTLAKYSSKISIRHFNTLTLYTTFVQTNDNFGIAEKYSNLIYLHQRDADDWRRRWRRRITDNVNIEQLSLSRK